MGSRGASAGTRQDGLYGLTKTEKGKVTKLVAMSAMLRDYADAGKDYEYVSNRHKMMADIADTLYNANIGAEYLKPEYKKIYDEFGKDFWNGVTKEMGRIDDSVGRSLNRAGAESKLLANYNSLKKEAE